MRWTSSDCGYTQTPSFPFLTSPSQWHIWSRLVKPVSSSKSLVACGLKHPGELPWRHGGKSPSASTTSEPPHKMQHRPSGANAASPLSVPYLALPYSARVSPLHVCLPFQRAGGALPSRGKPRRAAGLEATDSLWGCLCRWYPSFSGYTVVWGVHKSGFRGSVADGAPPSVTALGHHS